MTAFGAPFSLVRPVCKLVGTAQRCLPHTALRALRTSVRWLFVFCLLTATVIAAPEKAKKKRDKNAPDTLLGKPFITTVFPAGGQRGTTVEIVITGTNLATEIPEAPGEDTPTATGTATHAVIPTHAPAPTATAPAKSAATATPIPAPAAAGAPKTAIPSPAPVLTGSAKSSGTTAKTGTAPPIAKPTVTAKPSASPPAESREAWEPGTLRISGTGIKARITGTADPKSLRFTVQIDPKADLGERDVRVITKEGVSNRYRFFVGQIPEINEVEPNNDLAHAQPLASLPILVNGCIDQSDQDFFTFKAKPGQTIVCMAQARSIVPYIADAVPGWCDPVLTLSTTSGKVMQTVNGFRFNPEPLLVFQPSADDVYVLSIRDVLYRGRSDFIYRLSIGELPVITDVFPLGGRRGTPLPVEIRGVNLPVKSATSAVPADAASSPMVSIFNHGLESNRVRVAADDLPEFTETEPNDTPAQANRVELPVAINGRIGKAGDADYFAFTLKGKQAVKMEVRARRLGSPLDSVLTLFNEQGAEIADNDDTMDLAEPLMTHHADSRIQQTLAPGNYVLRIRDAEQRGGDEYSYRLLIGPPSPDFALRVMPANAVAGRGDTAVLNVAALRRDGFGGEIDLAMTDMPQGCIVSGTTLAPGQDETAITVTIPPDAPMGVFSPTIVGTGTIDGKQASRAALPAEPVMQAFATIHNVLTQEFLMAVTEPTAISFSTSHPNGKVLELKQGAEAEITVKVVRKAGVKGGVNVLPQKLPFGLTVKTQYIPADKDEVTVVIAAAKQAPVGVVRNVILSAMIKDVKRGASVAPAIPVRVLVDEAK